MTTKTKQLAVLMQLALQKNALLPVTTSQLLATLQDIENELETLSLYETDALAAKQSLQQLLQQVSGLLFVLKNKTVLHLSGDKYLLVRTETLHSKIVDVLKW